MLASYWNSVLNHNGQIIVIPTFVLYRLFKKAPLYQQFWKKSRYNILSFNGKETRVFAKVGITKSIFPFLFFLYNVDYRAT